MIAGELTDPNKMMNSSFYESEDFDAFFNRNTAAARRPIKKRSDTEKALKKENRQAWFQKRKENFQNAGGIAGIANTIGNVVGYYKDDTPSDYDISMGENPESSNRNNISKGAMLIGGTALVIIGFYAFSKMKKSKKVTG